LVHIFNTHAVFHFNGGVDDIWSIKDTGAEDGVECGAGRCAENFLKRVLGPQKINFRKKEFGP
jgi:hypothetical protein